MTSALPPCSLVSPYFPDPSVARANTAASKIDAWSAYASRSLDATPQSNQSPLTPTGGDYLGHFQDLQDFQHDVTSNSSFHLHLQNLGNATANNGKEFPTCFAPTSALFHRDKANLEEDDTADRLQQILTNLKIRCQTDDYKNPSSPDLSTTRETQSNAKILSLSPLSLSTQPRSLCAYNRQVYDATKSLYGMPTCCPTQVQHQYATNGNAPFLTGNQTYRYLNDVADDYSPGMLSPQTVSNLENLVSSPAPRSKQQVYEQPNKEHMVHKSGQLEGNYAWYMSENRLENTLHKSGNTNPRSGPYYGRPPSSTSDGSSNSLSSPASCSGKQTTAPVSHGNNSAVWGFDTQACLIDPIEGKHYGIAEEILAQQHAYPASFAPLNTEETFPASHSQVFRNIGPYPDAQQQAKFAPNVISRTNRNLHSLAISTSGLKSQLSSSMTSSPLPAQRGSFDGDLSIFNLKSAVFSGLQAGSHSFSQNSHQRRHSVSSNPPLSASSSSSTADSMTNQSSTSASIASANEKKVSLYKTELCRSFEETGSCRYGSKCQFAHGQEELRTVERHPKHKSVMCKTFWEQGSCPYGQRCCFIHTAVPSERGTVSIQSRAQFQSAPPSGTSHSLPAKPPKIASSAIPTGTHTRQPSASLSTLYPVEDDAVINAINVTVDIRKLAKGLTARTIPARTTSPTADKSTFDSTVVGSLSMQHRLRRASLNDAEDAGPTLNYKNKKSQCTCTRIRGVGSCFSCSANVTKTYNHLRSRTITSGELAYQQQQQQQELLQQQQQWGIRTARRSSLTEGGTRRLPIFQSIQS